MSENSAEPVKLVTTRPEAEVAADLKRRLEEAMVAVTKLFDEATQHGLVIQWDAIQPAPPFFRHEVRGLRIVKHY